MAVRGWTEPRRPVQRARRVRRRRCDDGPAMLTAAYCSLSTVLLPAVQLPSLPASPCSWRSRRERRRDAADNKPASHCPSFHRPFPFCLLLRRRPHLSHFSLFFDLSHPFSVFLLFSSLPLLFFPFSFFVRCRRFALRALCPFRRLVVTFTLAHRQSLCTLTCHQLDAHTHQHTIVQKTNARQRLRLRAGKQDGR